MKLNRKAKTLNQALHSPVLTWSYLLVASMYKQVRSNEIQSLLSTLLLGVSLVDVTINTMATAVWKGLSLHSVLMYLLYTNFQTSFQVS